MKNILKIALLLTMLQLTGCNDDTEISERDIKIEMLSRSWGNANVLHTTDGDLSDQYTNFMIAFTVNETNGFNGTYIISNGGYAFAEKSGKWKFNDELTQIVFDSGKEMDFQLDEAHLQLEFNTPSIGGRVKGLSGNFAFDLQPL